MVEPETGRIGRERTKILILAADTKPDLAARIAAAVDADQAEFYQQSAGLIAALAWGAF